MGVQIFLLDRRKITLLVDGRTQRIASVRPFCKATEIDVERAKEIDAAEVNHQSKPSPVAVMVSDFEECALDFFPEKIVAAHLVLAWEIGQTRTNDWNWDYLPTLGYAVKNADSNAYTLHEKQGGLLIPLMLSRANELEILNSRGKLIRRGQPSIIFCRYVQPYISTYAEAKCTLNDGNTVDLLTLVEPGKLPDPRWYIGKTPSQVCQFSAS